MLTGKLREINIIIQQRIMLEKVNISGTFCLTETAECVSMLTHIQIQFNSIKFISIHTVQGKHIFQIETMDNTIIINDGKMAVITCMHT